MEWNLGDILDAVEANVAPDTLALAHGSHTISWGETSKRTNRLARAFLAAGVKTGDKVAEYMRNKPAYTETFRACFKARLTPVNINYRYKPDEVHYIVENSDAAVFVYDAEFRDTVAEIRLRLPLVKLFVEVGDNTSKPDWASDYEALVTTGDGSPLGIKRSPDDLMFLYTGGTTGMPKGVMWRSGDLREIQLLGQRKLGLAAETMGEMIAALKTNGPSPAFLPACPLMHGTGLLSAIAVAPSAGAVVTLEGHSLDAHELWAAVDKHRIGSMAIVGDAFAKPMLRALEEKPGTYDLSSVITIVSSGVMWSVEVKRGLLKHMPQAVMTDSFGASEAVGLGMSQMTKDGEIPTAKFVIGDRCQVFDENNQPVLPGSGKTGMIAMPPPIPMGYFKDEAKTAKTFPTINGVRYSIPGDFCLVEPDGSLTLLGRGSATINTAGEKVFPEEVEEALKTHPSVEDALVVGVPDEKWGQAITAVVRLAPGFSLSADELKAHVKDRLAAYKAPKHVFSGEGVSMRAPNGKADYKSATAFARQQVNV